MILVFFILALIIIFSLLVFIVLISSVKLNISKLHISNVKSNKLTIEFKSKLQIYIFNKIKIGSIVLDDEKISNILKSGKIDIRKIRGNKKINKDILIVLKNFKYQIEKIKVIGYIGTENAALTAIICTILNTIITLIVSKKTVNYEKEKYNYKIESIYINQNIVNLDLNCIISIKIVHIISILYMLFKKESVNVNERTSNRRSYAYSYE